MVIRHFPGRCPGHSRWPCTVDRQVEEDDYFDGAQRPSGRRIRGPADSAGFLHQLLSSTLGLGRSSTARMFWAPRNDPLKAVDIDGGLKSSALVGPDLAAAGGTGVWPVRQRRFILAIVVAPAGAHGWWGGFVSSGHVDHGK